MRPQEALQGPGGQYLSVKREANTAAFTAILRQASAIMTAYISSHICVPNRPILSYQRPTFINVVFSSSLGSPRHSDLDP
jgi:hypothetical protein